jgi:hypothetical protein
MSAMQCFTEKISEAVTDTGFDRWDDVARSVAARILIGQLDDLPSNFVGLLAYCIEAEYPMDAAMVRKGWQVIVNIHKWSGGDRPQSSMIVNSPGNQDVRESVGLPRLLGWRIVTTAYSSWVESIQGERSKLIPVHDGKVMAVQHGR